MAWGSVQSYARDLDLALQAAQTDTVPLGDHLILSLLRATFNTLASRMPAAAVEALLSRDPKPELA